WNVGLNLTHYNTILKSLPDEVIENVGKAAWYLPNGTWTANGDVWSGSTGTYGAGSSSDIFYLRGVGRNWYNIYMHRYMGPDENGLPTYLHRVTEKEAADGVYPGKKAGDGVITNDYEKSDFWEVGNAIPDIIGGFNTTVTWKNWTLNANFAFQLGGKFYSHEYVQNLYNPMNISKSGRLVSKELVGNTWTPENTNAKFHMQWYNTGNSKYFTGTSANGTNWKFTDIALFSASYLRLKNITLSYNFPQKMLQKAGLDIISGLRVFASGDNVFLISAHKGVDPSLSATGGHEIGPYVYPNIQSFTFGVNVDF
ncbi:MAG: SusC/RagA family TonB-linked outer membrane protein, partial [Bacteroidales bacterium]|nr:SusC/RagA family TonB-linked outer membrane protein [Bacteroidales bacterium]